MKHYFAAMVLLLLLSVSRAAPANDNFESAELILEASGVRTGSNQGATSQEGEPLILGNLAVATVWFRWTAPTNGVLVVSTAGSSFDTLLAVYTGAALENLNVVAANDDSGGSTSMVSLLVDSGATYQVVVDGYEGGMGTIKLSANFTPGAARPVNDERAHATSLAGSNVVVTASNFLATMETEEFTPATSANASVWWTWQPPANGRYLITTVGSSFDTVLVVYIRGIPVAWNDNGETNRAASLPLHNALASDHYEISVQGFGKESGTIRLEIRPDPLAPAPAWTINDINGAAYHSTDYTGKVVLLNFWATWCAPCLDEIPGLKALQAKYGPEGFAVVAVSTDAQGFEVAGPVAEQYQFNYLSGVATPDLDRDYGPFQNIPITYLIDRNGMLAERIVGQKPLQDWDDMVRQLVSVTVALQASLVGSDVLLRWPEAAFGYELQSASNLISPNWSQVDAPISVVDGEKSVRLPLGGAQNCFRLIRN